VVEINLTKEDIGGIIVALQMRVNFIQTGNVILSSDDAAQRGKPVKALTDDQMRLILSIKGKIKEFQNMTSNHNSARVVGL